MIAPFQNEESCSSLAAHDITSWAAGASTRKRSLVCRCPPLPGIRGQGSGGSPLLPCLGSLQHPFHNVRPSRHPVPRYFLVLLVPRIFDLEGRFLLSDASTAVSGSGGSLATNFIQKRGGHLAEGPHLPSNEILKDEFPPRGI